MPYGTRSSQDIFQKKINQAFDKCKGAFAIADDIQVYGSDTNNDMHLHEAIERTRQAGLRLNYYKCVITTKSCTFLVMFTFPREWCQILKRLKPSKRCRDHRLNMNCTWCRFLILLVESCSKLVISVTEHLVEVVDKLSTTAVVLFRSERILKCKHLYGA